VASRGHAFSAIQRAPREIQTARGWCKLFRGDRRVPLIRKEASTSRSAASMRMTWRGIQTTSTLPESPRGGVSQPLDAFASLTTMIGEPRHRRYAGEGGPLPRGWDDDAAMGPGPDPRPGLQSQPHARVNDFTLASPPRPRSSVDPPATPSGHSTFPPPANSVPPLFRLEGWVTPHRPGEVPRSSLDWHAVRRSDGLL